MRDQVIAGRYRLDKRIGSGGMGVVWRATDLELRRVVALKQSQAGDDGQLRREARIGAGLHHPNVVSVFDVVLDADVRWLVMEYLPSRSLSETVEADGPLSAAAAARIGAQLANALAAIHDRGMVHGDIKPGNVLIAEDGTAKLTDFGIARWAELTQTGGAQFAGTPGYLAPEVAEGREVRPPADMFALGATLFAALVGCSPWGANDQGPRTQLRRAVSGELSSLPDVGALTPVLTALLETVPARRPTARMVNRMLEDITGEATPLTPLPAPAPGRRWIRNRSVPVSLGVAAALVAGFVTGFAWRSPVTEVRTVQEPSAIGVMGDERTADPCSLIEVASLARFGDVEPDADFGPFYNCFVRVRLSQDEADVAVVRVELRGVLDPPPPDYRRGRLGPIQRPAARKGECPRYIWMPDGHEIGVFARHEGNRPADLCGMAEAVASGAITVLAAGEVPRRAAAPGNSLRNLNACELLEPADVTAVLGVAGVKPEPDFGQWTCYWEQAPLQVIVDFHRKRPQIEGPDGTKITVGSREAYVEPGQIAGDDDIGCEITITHRRYRAPDPDDGDWIEAADVTVETKAQIPAERRCDLAIGLARSVADRLPPP
ncbi:serine/threonine-protein kinase [Amycolatopsis sp. QT-25]|uniref:serine/threonine-protein kinase n=1 Tax=Amycolatopsis sp. QT-25 TaxID=3034022 RepID=UPI0023EA9D74|nr:serine/threonine-protein kinase [Amycolatopsis sp. QT-25]WET82429.1 serine/threonine-protein kinase [Amycolatopsis sp. QT-25]